MRACIVCESFGIGTPPRSAEGRGIKKVKSPGSGRLRDSQDRDEVDEPVERHDVAPAVQGEDDGEEVVGEEGEGDDALQDLKLVGEGCYVCACGNNLWWIDGGRLWTCGSRYTDDKSNRRDLYNI